MWDFLCSPFRNNLGIRPRIYVRYNTRGKNVRLQHLTPIPCGESLAAIAAQLLKQLDAASASRVDQQGRTVAQRFDEERALLRALPERPFEARQVELVGVSRQALVRVDGAQYSVPSHWAGSQVLDPELSRPGSR